MCFSGVFCESAVGAVVSSDYSSPGTGVVAACVVIALVLLATVVLYGAWHVHRKRKMTGHYEPSQVEKNSPSPIPMERMIDETRGEVLV